MNTLTGRTKSVLRHVADATVTTMSRAAKISTCLDRRKVLDVVKIKVLEALCEGLAPKVWIPLNDHLKSPLLQIHL